MNEFQLFKGDDFGEIRVVTNGGEPWFCLTDVCKVLGLTNPTTSADRLSSDCKSKFNLGLSGKQPLFVNEDGLYDVILDSRKPIAKKFRKWITSEVIPSIRKTGAYQINNQPPQSDAKQLNMELMLVEKAASILNLNESSRIMMLRKVGDRHGMSDLLPDYAQIEDAPYSASELLKRNAIGISPKAFNDLLVHHGYLKNMTHTKSNGKITTFRSVTDKGKEFGDNFMDSHSNGTTQPKWYSGRFERLCKCVGLAV